MAPEVPPLLVVALAAGSMRVSSRLVPRAPGIPGGVTVAAVLALTGFGITLLGVLAFRRAGPTVNPMDPGAASERVGTSTASPATRCASASRSCSPAGRWRSAAWRRCSRSPYVLYIDRFQIVPEERALEEVPGERYLACRERVRRCI